MTPVGKGLGRLEGVVESGSYWKALCPAHDAREPSLSVSEADDGPALIKCFAGCEAIGIIAGLGLEMGDLFERRNRHRRTFTLPSENDTIGGKDIPHSYSTEGSRLSLMLGKEVPDGSLA